MNAIFDRFHNFILPLLRGKDHVCSCICGSHQAYHVVPYNGVQSMAASKENYFLSDIMTRQKMDLIVGLLLGLCISGLLLCLDRVWHSGLKYWRANRMNDVGFWSRMPKFSNTRDLFGRLYPQHAEDSGGNRVHIKQDGYRYVNGSI